jgi:sugar lactone lactonase YvrE
MNVKWIQLGLAIALFAMPLAACGGGSGGGGPPPVVSILYAADGKAGAPGQLYVINPATGAATAIGPIGYAITGLALSPTGVLYATESVNWGRGPFNDARLIQIDRTTGAGTPIGPLQDSVMPANNHGAIAGLTFVGTRLIGWSEMNDEPVEIDTTTAVVTELGGGTNSYGSGVATNAAGTLYACTTGDGEFGGTLDTVNPVTGVVTVGPALSDATGPEDAICGLTFLNGVLYCVLNEDINDPLSACNLGTIDTTTGVITLVGPLPSGIDAIAGWAP